MSDQPKERPILFTAAMVAAILDDRKTQTRRVMKPQPYQDMRQPGLVRSEPKSCFVWEPRENTTWFDWGKGFDPMIYIDGPYQPGDRLWVRETWGYWGSIQTPEWVIYRADGGKAGMDWRASIHMPRWASRLTLEIVDVRMQRLFDISEADAQAEGVSIEATRTLTHRGAFAITWDAINKKRGFGWEEGTNPWVWVIGFRRVTP